MTLPRVSRRVALFAIVLVTLTAGLLAVERAGVRVRFPWQMGGDLRREARIFEQYGQVASALVIGLLIWTLDPARRRLLPAFAIALLVTAGVATVGKNLIGRERPISDRDAAAAVATTLPADDEDGGGKAGGRSKRESFPSGHTAGAVATAVVLSAVYPRGRAVFWGLAVACGFLRYVSNAHWPSDVVAGAAVGYVTAHLVWDALVGPHPPPAAAHAPPTPPATSAQSP
jgi:membrane-associated phospholipid phosphatase